MEGARLLQKVRLTNFLSYGPEGEEIELQPLNVLIGPNGSGKSNFIEAVGVLRAAPGDLVAPIRNGGGLPEWIWKGGGAGYPHFRLETVVVPFPDSRSIRYALEITYAGQFFELADEIVEDAFEASPDAPDTRHYYRFNRGSPVLLSREAVQESNGEGYRQHYRDYRPPGGVPLNLSILSQIRDSEHYPTITRLGEALSEIRLFRNISAGPQSPLRGPQRADEPSSFLIEDGRNLGVVLNDLLNHPPVKKRFLQELRRFYGQVGDITTKIHANTVETFFHEPSFPESTPSIRVSDGMLRYLSLLCILCHPHPPALVCIEEPEVGMHPDVLPVIAELMIEASQRMQLIVTTHSDILVSALGDVPEAVVVCERDDRGTHLRRLNPEALKEWLKDYSLGGLWLTGELGGNP